MGALELGGWSATETLCPQSCLGQDTQVGILLHSVPGLGVVVRMALLCNGRDSTECGLLRNLLKIIIKDVIWYIF